MVKNTSKGNFKQTSKSPRVKSFLQNLDPDAIGCWRSEYIKFHLLSDFRSHIVAWSRPNPLQPPTPWRVVPWGMQPVRGGRLLLRSAANRWVCGSKASGHPPQPSHAGKGDSTKTALNHVYPCTTPPKRPGLLLWIWHVHTCPLLISHFLAIVPHHPIIPLSTSFHQGAQGRYSQPNQWCFLPRRIRFASSAMRLALPPSCSPSPPRRMGCSARSSW